jgi:hypothetical protein
MLTFKHYYDKDYYGGPKGGYTIAIDHERKTAGISICSKKDQFNKKVGRQLATSRAESFRFFYANSFKIMAPVAKSEDTDLLLRRAMFQLLGYIMYTYPGAGYMVSFR